jgi:hypothetical protein
MSNKLFSFETPKRTDVLDHFSKTQLEIIGKFNNFDLTINLKFFEYSEDVGIIQQN